MLPAQPTFPDLQLIAWTEEFQTTPSFLWAPKQGPAFFSLSNFKIILLTLSLYVIITIFLSFSFYFIYLCLRFYAMTFILLICFVLYLFFRIYENIFKVIWRIFWHGKSNVSQIYNFITYLYILSNKRDSPRVPAYMAQLIASFFRWSFFRTFIHSGILFLLWLAHFFFCGSFFLFLVWFLSSFLLFIFSFPLQLIFLFVSFLTSPLCLFFHFPFFLFYLFSLFWF